MANQKWEEQEVEYLDTLGQGDKGGYLAWDIIASRINESFGNYRTTAACKARFLRIYKNKSLFRR
jgi:hypothetical protein